MRGETLLGTAKVDITPDKPIPLAGYSHRRGPFEAVHRRMQLRINSFQQEENGKRRRLLLVQGDIIWWGSERMDNIRRKLSERYGFEASEVILNASHTHGSPQTSAVFCSNLGLPDQDYLNRLDNALISGVESALANLEPVTVERGYGECRFGINRRKQMDGKIVMAPNPDGPIDPEVTVIRFRKLNGGTKAVFIHYTCHPTTTSDNAVTSDYPGIAAAHVEETVGGGAVVSFLQGFTGNVRPALHRDGRFYSGHDEDVVRLGHTLADEVLRVLASPMQPLRPCRLAGERLVVKLPYQRLPSEEEIRGVAEQGGHYAEWAELMRSGPRGLRTHEISEMTRLDIADGFSLLAMDGEVVVEYGLYVKERSRGRVLPLGYSNGMIGYVPTSKQIIEGGYESEQSCYSFAMPRPFDTQIEHILHDALADLIDGIGRDSPER
jgi:hypothetical protein